MGGERELSPHVQEIRFPANVLSITFGLVSETGVSVPAAEGGGLHPWSAGAQHRLTPNRWHDPMPVVSQPQLSRRGSILWTGTVQ